ncbi:MAG: hypothetical protein J0L75_11015 [Spirochaetes bacterium]|nr:hypothetical protein [Spirochaetota bacterium]
MGAFAATLPTAVVEECSGNTAILRLYPESGQVLDYPSDGLVSNMVLYSIQAGEVRARLRYIRKSPPRLEAEVLTGKVRRGDPISLSLALSWEHLFSHWDASRIAAYYRARVEEHSAHLLDLEVSRLAYALGFTVRYDLRTEEGVEAFLARAMDSLAQKDPRTRRAWQRYGLLLYRHFVLGQNIAGTVDLFLDGESIPETLDDGLFLRAVVHGEQGRTNLALADLGRILDRKKSIAMVVKASLLLARWRLDLGDTNACLKYLKALVDDPRTAEAGDAYQDEARLEYAGLLTKIGVLDPARKAILQIRQDPGNPGVLARVWFLEYSLLGRFPGNEAEARRLKEGFEATFPDSPLLSEFDWIQAQDAVARSPLPGLRRFDALSEVMKRWPTHAAGVRAYHRLARAAAELGEWSELARLLTQTKTVFPAGPRAWSPIPTLLPTMKAAILAEGGEASYPRPLVNDTYFFNLLEDTRTNYAPGPGRENSRLSRFNQELSLLRWIVDPVLEQYGVYDPELVSECLETLYDLAQVRAVDPLGRTKELRRLSRAPSFPPPARSMLSWKTFTTFTNVDPAYAEKNALEILRLGADARHVDGIFDWYEKTLRGEFDPRVIVLRFERLRKSYDRLDLRLSDLRRRMASWPQAPELLARLAAGEVPGRPEHAIVWNAANGFEAFPLRRDLRDLGTNLGCLILQSEGPRAGLETRFLTLRARDFHFLSVTVLQPDAETADQMDGGTFWWQGWDQTDWSPAQKIPFLFLGSGEVTAVVPLDRAEWKDSVKRLRLDFFTEALPSRRVKIHLKEIALY